ncbi:unnamed protein product, partial [Rotaria sp. Silwood1]
RNILRSCTINNSITIRRPLRFLDFLEYEGFMARLRAREQQGRSLRVLINPIDKSVEASYSYALLNHCYIKYTKRLIKKLEETRKRLEGNSDWPHKSRPITDEELQFASNCIAPHAVAQLSLANPWPTREMSGVEVLVEHTFPYDLKQFLPVPTVTYLSQQPTPSVLTHYSFHILWITSDKNTETVDNLIKDIQNSLNTPKLLTHMGCEHKLDVFQTIEEAQQWLKTNQELIRQPHIRFKVVTSWTIQKDKTAIDVIRAVRAELARVPVLIFTNKHDEIQAALEFPNVIVTDKEFELKEFVGIKQETLWNTGCRVSHKDDTSQPPVIVSHEHEGKPDNSSTLPYPSEDNAWHTNGSGFPPLPVSDFFPAPARTSSQSSSLTSDASRTPPLKPMLFWIDLPENDIKTVREIQKHHPTLEIIFKSTYKDAEEYLTNNLREIQKREIFFTICRGYFAQEKKSFTDVATLFQDLNIGTRPLGVYTSSKTNLLKYMPNPPKSVNIFDKQPALLTFVDDCLKLKS